jgi:hypothetical protein
MAIINMAVREYQTNRTYEINMCLKGVFETLSERLHNLWNVCRSHDIRNNLQCLPNSNRSGFEG